MKRLLLVIFLTLACAPVVFGRASSVYENDGSFNSPPSTPPQIDATNFINNGLFNLAFDSYNGLSVSTLNGALLGNSIVPYDFSDVLYYTNRGSLICDVGFTFDTASPSNGVRHAAAIFGNSNVGSVVAGSATNSSTSAFIFYVSSGGLGSGIPTGLPQINITATNIYNSGLLDTGVTGLIKVFGNRLDLSRGTIHVEGFDDFSTENFFSGGTNSIFTNLSYFSTFNLGIFNSEYGVGLQSNQLSDGNFSLPFPSSPFSLVTNDAGLISDLIVDPFNAAAYAYTNRINASNISYQVVFINTNLPGVSVDVRFQGGGVTTPVVEWASVITNNYGSPSITNYLFLTDEFGSFPTNTTVTNSFSYSQIPQIAPYNYQFFRSYSGYTNLPGPNSNPYNEQTFFATAFPTTNAYSAYEVNVAPVAFEPDPTAVASPLTNLPGRVQIAATNWLDLTRSKITGANYLNVQATNHFVGSPYAQILVPNMDVNVASTNGMLSISNLVAPYIPRFNGTIDLYSARWTNILASGLTNRYHVLFVNSTLAPTSSVSILNFAARSTNVFISDDLNVTNSLLINAANLTVTTNSPTSPTVYGQINVNNPDILWSSSFPVLQNLTNYGQISTSNTTYFYGARQAPYYPTNFSQPYLSFVNYGAIFSAGNSIWANYIENNGTGISNVYNFGGSSVGNTNNAWIYSLAGPIRLQASNAVLTADSIIAIAGDETITVGSLLASNHLFQTSGALTFSITNTLIDGGAASSNFWTAGDGMNLLVKPSVGDFLGTTITLTSPAELEVEDVWAGIDLGANVNGFMNNGAMGHLILDGGDNNSQFYFGGLSSTNKYAIYIDQLELRDGATNRINDDGVESFTTFDLAPNFTIYYADAVIGQSDISEKLNGANNGQLVWVPAYVGIFSGTNIVFPAGVTNSYNRALASSPDIDSDNDGIPNAYDTTPFFTPANVALKVSMTNLPPKRPLISWYALGNSTNHLYFLTNFATTNALEITNFVQGPANGIVSVIDRNRTNGTGFYRVREDPAQP